MDLVSAFVIISALIGFVLYLGVTAAVLWIGYRLARAAVKYGILDADAERASALQARASNLPPAG
jgi:UPF0716 family protein affecting phage T7 exclusion